VRLLFILIVYHEAMEAGAMREQ